MQRIVSKLIWVAILLVLLSIVAIPGWIQRATAQSNQDIWSLPANLSQSGSTTNPVIAVDSNQNVHVIWVDAFTDYGYAYWNGERWSDPIGQTYLFYPEIPKLVAGADGLVHLFWITDTGALLYSRALGTDLGNPNALAPPQVLAGGVLNFHVSADEQGRLHLGYVEGPNENGISAGVYYRQADSSGTSWSLPTNVYLSPYFRSIPAENAHVYTAATEVGDSLRVYIAFDNSALKRVFLATSTTSGASWEPPQEIDQPDSQSVTNTPFEIIVHPDQLNILVMWKNNLQSSFDCTQYYQVSTDGGATWGEKLSTFNDLVGCPQGNYLFSGPENSVLLLADIQESTYIQAWNWEQWSDPQIQGGLNQFTDPVTFSDLRLADKRAAVGDNFLLYVTGADKVGNQDIWATSRKVDDISSWFPPPQAWKPPQIISESTGYLNDPVLLSDNRGLFHQFWTQSADPENPQDEWRIYYSQFDGLEWLAPVGVLKSPDKYASEISATLAGDLKVFVSWLGHDSGDIYFAWAQPDRAYSVFEWSDPQPLRKPPNTAANPQIFYGRNTALYVLFTIPINEGRGVYLIESTDEGVTWTEPKIIFDGARANWTVVGPAEITQTDNGDLHVLVSQKARPDDDFATALHYLSSKDGGQTWSSALMVIDQPLTDFRIIAADQLTIHRYWQTDVGADSRLWHEVSLDSGLTWITSTPLSVLGNPGPSDMVLDSLNRVHLVQRFSDNEDHQILQHWEWQGNSWESLDVLQSNQMDEPASGLTAYAGPDGRLVSVSLEQKTNTSNGALTSFLLATDRFLDDDLFLLTPVAPAPIATETPASGEPVDAQVTPLEDSTDPETSAQATSTPTPTPISFEGMDDIRPPTNSIMFLVVGVGSAVVIMVLLFIISRLRSR